MLSGPNHQGLTLPNISISPRDVYSVMKAPLDSGKVIWGFVDAWQGSDASSADV